MQRQYSGKSNVNQGARGASSGKGSAASNFTPSPKGTQPKYLLKVKEVDAEGNASFRTLTGLFEHQTKSGVECYRGTDKLSGMEFYILPKIVD